MRGLDPRIHTDSPQIEDAAWIAGSSQVKPGNDERSSVINSNGTCFKWRFPGAAQHDAQRSGAPQTRDRYKRSAMKCPVFDDPGSAVHRCALHRIRETGVG
jgi:hypothetical protein